MRSVEELLAKYPDLEIVEVEQELDQATFDAQKVKHEARNAEGALLAQYGLMMVRSY